MTPRKVAKTEFGDFQTPRLLSEQVCELLAARGLKPSSVVEPTCGVGNFLLASLRRFPHAVTAVAGDINPDYVRASRESLGREAVGVPVQLFCQSFFQTGWEAILRSLPEPILVVGNPPWVTNAGLGALGSANAPTKENAQQLKGIEAITGKSNFDISEWMLIRLLDWLNDRRATIAMLCKTAVARKVLSYAWKARIGLAHAEMRKIDASLHFGAAVEACLLVLSLRPGGACDRADVFDSLAMGPATGSIGLRDGTLVPDLVAFDRWKHLRGPAGVDWRSGIKHDCSAVMELRWDGCGALRNGLGEVVSLEEDYLFPMLKSSDVAGGKVQNPRRRMLVTQRRVGEDTAAIRLNAPRTWGYLQAHAARLATRGSSIYRNRPPFAVFGVGEYSFAPWKVAVSGLYKALQFAVVGSCASKPIVVDDTVYFCPCRSQAEAEFIASLLNSDVARDLFRGLVFWDAKRPITADLLRYVDLRALARELGKAGKADTVLGTSRSPADRRTTKDGDKGVQFCLFGT